MKNGEDLYICACGNGGEGSLGFECCDKDGNIVEPIGLGEDGIVKFKKWDGHFLCVQCKDISKGGEDL